MRVPVRRVKFTFAIGKNLMLNYLFNYSIDDRPYVFVILSSLEFYELYLFYFGLDFGTKNDLK